MQQGQYPKEILWPRSSVMKCQTRRELQSAAGQTYAFNLHPVFSVAISSVAQWFSSHNLPRLPVFTYKQMITNVYATADADLTRRFGFSFIAMRSQQPTMPRMRNYLVTFRRAFRFNLSMFILTILFCFSVRNAGMRAAVCAAKVAHAHIRRVLRVRRRTEEVLETSQAVSLYCWCFHYGWLFSKVAGTDRPKIYLFIMYRTELHKRSIENHIY